MRAYIVEPRLMRPAKSVRITLVRVRNEVKRVQEADSPDKLIPAISDQIYYLTGALDIEEVAAALDEEKFE